MSLIIILTSFVAPLPVGLLTKASMPGSVKSVALLTINALGALGQQYIGNPHGSLRTAAITTIVGFTISVGTHYGLWTKIGLTSFVQQLLVKDPALVQAAVSATPDESAVTDAAGQVAAVIGGDKSAA